MSTPHASSAAIRIKNTICSRKVPVFGRYIITSIPGEANLNIDEDLVQVAHSLETNLPITTTKLEEIQQATANDEFLQRLCAIASARRPDHAAKKKKVPLSLRPYWHIRDSYT